MKSVRESTWLGPALIVGVVALVAGSAPFVVGAGRDQAWALEVAALRVDEAVSKARQLAMTSGRAHAVVFDTARERFGIVDVDGVLARDADTGGPALVELRQVPGGEELDLVEAVFGSAEPRAMVAPDGSLVLSGRVVLRCGEDEREVHLVGTGEVGAQASAEAAPPADDEP